MAPPAPSPAPSIPSKALAHAPMDPHQNFLAGECKETYKCEAGHTHTALAGLLTHPCSHATLERGG